MSLSRFSSGDAYHNVIPHLSETSNARQQNENGFAIRKLLSFKLQNVISTQVLISFFGFLRLPLHTKTSNSGLKSAVFNQVASAHSTPRAPHIFVSVFTMPHRLPASWGIRNAMICPKMKMYEGCTVLQISSGISVTAFLHQDTVILMPLFEATYVQGFITSLTS